MADSYTSLNILDQLAGISLDQSLVGLRTQRADVARFAQGSYDALLNPPDPAGVSLVERGLIALHVALISHSAPLAAHYRQRLVEHGAPVESIGAVEQFPKGDALTPRMASILQHATMLIHEPHTATPAHLAQLQMHGLSGRDLVTISQLVAFLSFQVRVLAGLQLLAEEV